MREGIQGCYALGDIAQDDGEELLTVFSELRNGRLNRKLGAICAQAGEHGVVSHAPRRDTGLPEPGDVAGMARAQARRYQLVERLANDAGARP